MKPTRIERIERKERMPARNVLRASAQKNVRRPTSCDCEINGICQVQLSHPRCLPGDFLSCLFHSYKTEPGHGPITLTVAVTWESHGLHCNDKTQRDYSLTGSVTRCATRREQRGDHVGTCKTLSGEGLRWCGKGQVTSGTTLSAVACGLCEYIIRINFIILLRVH
jgi:hypothetical protein